MRIINTISLPPLISQYFDKKLLSLPVHKFCDDSKKLLMIYEYIVQKLQRKCKSREDIIKFNILSIEFVELYERTKAKEKDIETKTGKPYGEPFYRFRYVDKYHKGLSGRLRNKSLFFR